MNNADICFNCWEETGNAGVGDGSIYTDDGEYGPFCEGCWAAWKPAQRAAYLAIAEWCDLQAGQIWPDYAMHEERILTDGIELVATECRKRAKETR